VEVLGAVLGAALLHASWNALIKSGRDVALDTALVALSGCVVGAPLLALAPMPAPAAWPWLAASTAIHVAYFTTLAAAYRAGDLSHAYPIMRGTAPLFVALGTLAAGGDALPASGWLGVVLICAGVMSRARLKGASGAGVSRRATAWAIANAAIIACYTLVDGRGVRLAGDALGYIAWIFCFMGLPYGLIVLARRRGALLQHARDHWRRGAAGAAMSGVSYGIAVWAMSRAPVPAVAALRETSVVFAALIGAWLLKEGRLRPRLGGALVVLAGVVALRW
jgi:drug/metabolite transporter (DMT)-like permease